MLLSGHEGDVFCTKFAPSGQFLASAGFDRLICTLQFHCFDSVTLYKFVSSLTASSDAEKINEWLTTS